MSRKFIRRWTPSPERVQSDRKLRWLKPVLNKPYLWHLNRHSVARGYACGAFWSMWPVWGQFIPSTLITVKIRGNIPVSFAALWLSNPLTIIPHWWSAYLIGRLILRTPPVDVNYHRVTELHWLIDNFWHFYVPVFIGSLLEGVFLAAAGYFLITPCGRATHENAGV